MLSDNRISGPEIAEHLGISTQHVSRIRARFVEGGVNGRADHPKQVAKITLFRGGNGADDTLATYGWQGALETRLLAAAFKLASATVSKAPASQRTEADLVRTYKVSRDPELPQR